jgi:hypothetical protein
MRPQTIQIFLPDGLPTSIREAEITNRLVKAILFPRNKIQKVVKREMVHYTGVYFLFGRKEESAKPIVYIGEGENCFERIKEHNKNKDFWTHCVIVVTKTNDYTKTDAKFLEHYGLKIASENSRFIVENSTGSNEPSLSESKKHDLLDNFETIKILLATLGYSLFDDTKKKTTKLSSILFIKFKDLIAKGEYIDEGFIIYKGSEVRKNYAASFRSTQIVLRDKLILDKVLEVKSDRIIFLEDYIFPSPSAASDMVKANSSNGWVEWKNKEGKTLDELKRK